MTATNTHIDVEALKTAAAGRWPEILTAVGGIDPSLLDRKHHPCPKKCCDDGGGKDRFNLVSEERGAVRCNRCFAEKNGDGIAAIRWLCDCSFPEALQRIAKYLGVQNDNGNGKTVPSDPLELVARQKGVESADLEAFGAHVDGPNVVFPMIGWKGHECSTFTLTPGGGKGMCAEGKPAGMFFPGRLPKAGETWHIVEGVKDAAALHGLGFLAAGMSTCMMNAKFSRLFAGCDVILVPDRDVAAIDGAKRTSGGLYDVAKSIRLAALPAEVTKKDGPDVRDILKKQDGRELVLTAIRDARPVDADGSVRGIRLLNRYAAAQLATGNFDLNYLVDNVLVEGAAVRFWRTAQVAQDVDSDGPVDQLGDGQAVSWQVRREQASAHRLPVRRERLVCAGRNGEANRTSGRLRSRGPGQ